MMTSAITDKITKNTFWKKFPKEKLGNVWPIW